MSLAPVPVILVESGRSYGGTERVLDAIARRLDRQRYRPMAVLDPVPALDAWADELRRAGVPVERLAEIENRWQWARAARWFRFLRARRHALLHVHHVWPSADRYLVPLAHLAGVRAVVATDHLSAPPHSRTQRALKRWEASRADVVTTVSERVADGLAGHFELPRDACVVIPNGVTAPPPLDGEERARLRGRWGVPPSARLWLSVGRLEPQKGVDVLLAAWAALPTPRPHLVVAGDGSERAALEERMRALSLEDGVRFLGAVPDARLLYRVADGVVLASRFEGMPLVLLEAMAAGLPVVATAVGGVPEATEGGTRARLVPPEDPAALARAIQRLERAPEEARALGLAAQSWTEERFGEARMVSAYEAVYRRALRLGQEAGGGGDRGREAA